MQPSTTTSQCRQEVTPDWSLRGPLKCESLDQYLYCYKRVLNVEENKSRILEGIHIHRKGQALSYK